jgi:hypothetical protein
VQPDNLRELQIVAHVCSVLTIETNVGNGSLNKRQVLGNNRLPLCLSLQISSGIEACDEETLTQFHATDSRRGFRLMIGFDF